MIKGNEFKNNNFSKVGKPNKSESLTGWVYEYNNFHKSFQPPSGTGNTSNDPKFIDEKSGNFRLQPDSPLIDKGKLLDGVKFDFDGNRRPLGKSIDMGAFEFQDRTTSSIKADAGKDQSICSGNSAVLTASGGT